MSRAEESRPAEPGESRSVERLRTIVERGEVAALKSLLRELDLAAPVEEELALLPLALARGAFGVAARLLRVRRRLGDPVVVRAAGIPQALVEELIAAKVAFAAESLISIAEPGGVEEATFIAQNGLRHEKKEWKTLRKRLDEVSRELDDQAIAVDNGEATGDGFALRDRAANLRDLSRRLRPWWGQLL